MVTQSTQLSRYSYLLSLLILLAAAGLIWIFSDASIVPAIPLLQTGRFPNFVTMFLGIFMEAVPFLLAGSLVSGFIDVFVDKQTLLRFVPRRPLAAVAAGSLLGLVFPVCECGVVPVIRRLYRKGMPLPAGVAFLLAAPIMNPIVLASTVAAFGWGAMLAGRVLLGLAIANGVAMLFYLARPEDVLRSHSAPAVSGPDKEFISAGRLQSNANAAGGRFRQAIAIAGNDFADMARFLIVGAMLAAAIQTLLSQTFLLNLGSDPFLSVLSMMGFAFALSLCSTVDAFVALSFVTSFSPAAILSFLVFGPMVDIKSALMFLSIFRRRTVLYLVLLPLTLTLVVTVYLNLNVAW
jgi:uncharacterized protein